jgi:hypothetical protein
MDRRTDDASVTETVAQTSPSVPRISTTSSHDEGRFIAGTLLAGMWAVLELVQVAAGPTNGLSQGLSLWQ